MNILFICTGNTCRSPMAQGILKSKKIAWLNTESRGICAYNSPPCYNAVAAMNEIGIDISDHISSQLTAADISWADKILCLSQNHLQTLNDCGIKGKNISVLAGGIPDPFGGDLETYRTCRDKISQAIDRLFEDGFFSDFTVSEIEPRNIEAVAKLEKECFSEPWSAAAITESINHGTLFFVAENGEDVMGYIGLNAVADECYITNIAVFPDYRRRGVATALLNKAISYCKSANLSFISLEVRASNNAAIDLYVKNGFIKEGERRNFYRFPKENAFIMTRRFNYDNENTKH